MLKGTAVQLILFFFFFCKGNSSCFDPLLGHSKATPKPLLTYSGRGLLSAVSRGLSAQTLECSDSLIVYLVEKKYCIKEPGGPGESTFL